MLFWAHVFSANIDAVSCIDVNKFLNGEILPIKIVWIQMWFHNVKSTHEKWQKVSLPPTLDGYLVF
jgi:hypothetical protein